MKGFLDERRRRATTTTTLTTKELSTQPVKSTLLLVPVSSPHRRRCLGGVLSSLDALAPHLPPLPSTTTLPSKRHATGTLVTADAAGCCIVAAHDDEISNVPLPLDCEALFSTEGRARRMAGLRELVTASAAADKALTPRSSKDSSTSSSSSPSVIGLHGGFPPASSFPFVKLTATLRDGTVVEVEDPAEVFAAQQYSVALRGYAPLHSWAVRHVMEQHAPPGGVLGFETKKKAETAAVDDGVDDIAAAAVPALSPSLPPPHDVMITNGNNPTLEAVLRLFCDRGDDLLCEEYTYPHVAESLALPAGIIPVPVACDFIINDEDSDDGGGIRPEALDAAIAARVASRPDKKAPKLLYTVPVGQNPTGAVAGLERRKKVYAVCRKWGVAIVEDDPYYYLQYGNDKKKGEETNDESEQELKGLRGLGASYLSLDVDGRVIRLDSFSKVLFPGVRLGWATAPRAVIDKLVCHLHGVALGAPPLAQVLTSALLVRAWGGEGNGGEELSSSPSFAGFERHVKTMQREYRRRASVAHAAASRHLPGLASWRRPSAGMFLWATLSGDLAPLADAALARARSSGVVVVPGAYAHCSGDRARPCASFRLSFAGASDDALEEGIRRLGEALRATREEMMKK